MVEKMYFDGPTSEEKFLLSNHWLRDTYMALIATILIFGVGLLVSLPIVVAVDFGIDTGPVGGAELGIIFLVCLVLVKFKVIYYGGN